MIEEPEPNTWLYHEAKAPQGQIFFESEVDKLLKRGWVRNPGYFNRGFIGKFIHNKKIITDFWKANWKVLIQAFIALLGIIIATAVTLFVHFDSQKSERKTNTKSKHTITNTNGNTNHK